MNDKIILGYFRDWLKNKVELRVELVDQDGKASVIEATKSKFTIWNVNQS